MTDAARVHKLILDRASKMIGFLRALAVRVLDRIEHVEVLLCDRSTIRSEFDGTSSLPTILEVYDAFTREGASLLPKVLISQPNGDLFSGITLALAIGHGPSSLPRALEHAMPLTVQQRNDVIRHAGENATLLSLEGGSLLSLACLRIGADGSLSPPVSNWHGFHINNMWPLLQQVLVLAARIVGDDMGESDTDRADLLKNSLRHLEQMFANDRCWFYGEGLDTSSCGHPSCQGCGGGRAFSTSRTSPASLRLAPAISKPPSGTSERQRDPRVVQGMSQAIGALSEVLKSL